MNAKLFNVDYLKYLCKRHGLVPSSKYGQNFLINQEAAEAMVSAGGVSRRDTVVEVGPGFGALTFALADKAKKVVAFEIEKKIKPYWDEKMEELKNVEIIWGNALSEIDSPNFIKSVKSYKVVANLPYQITSNLIRKFLESPHPPAAMTLMVQKEVGERICATAGDMSVLALSVQYYAQPNIAAAVKRNNFWPEPAVDSVILCLKLKKDADKAGAERFFQAVKAGFSQKRKFLIKNLAGYYDKNAVKTALAELGLSETARAQELSLEQWMILAKRLIHTYL